MKVKLLHGYRGVMSDQVYYAPGDYDESQMPKTTMLYLVNMGFAVAVLMSDQVPDAAAAEGQDLNLMKVRRGLKRG